ncbi:MAG: VWA domain-containing protein [Myxococcota bacterium]
MRFPAQDSRDVVTSLGVNRSRTTSEVGLGLVMALVSVTACTDSDLFQVEGLGTSPFDNKLAIQTDFCTEDPTTLDFPTKILFVVDTSQSINRTDPEGRRLLAVQEVVDAFIDDPGVSFGIIQFSGQVSTLTSTTGQDGTIRDGFTRDRMELDTAIVRLGVAESTTDYEGALAQVLRLLSADMLDSDEEDLSRSRYIIIFLSDGLPNPVDPPQNTRSSILERMSEIAELEEIFRPASLNFHTALVLGATRTGFRCTDLFLEGGDEDCEALSSAALCATNPDCVFIGVEDEAIDLLCAMSEVGNGTCRSFPNGEEINFLRIDFSSIRRVFTLKNLVASNQNARPRLLFENSLDQVGRAAPDSDGDGLDDEEETRFGTELLMADTDEDGFNDFVEVFLGASGFDPLDPSDADCTFGLDRVDTDGDGLLDCEERFIGTNRLIPDTEADGFPDDIELRNGTNASENDVRNDLDFDSARNGDELRGHSDPSVNDAARRGAISYRYEIEERDLNDLDPDDPRVKILEEGRLCYDVRIENITLAETLPEVGGRNRVYIYINQAPFDDPEDFGVFRIACVEQAFQAPDFRNPPFQEVQIPSEAFKALTDFDPDVDCTVGTPVSTVEE